MKAKSNVSTVLHGVVYGDDTKFVQDCIDRGLSPPPGTYRISSPIIIHKNYQISRKVIDAARKGES